MPVYEGPSWNTGGTTTVTWSFASTNFNMSATPGYVAFDAPIADFYKAGVRAAFQSWSSVANINFVEVTDSASAQIRLGTHNIGGATAQGQVLGDTLIWYQGSSLKAAEVMFDPAAFSPSTFYEVAEHEIGHAIGLDHSASPSNVMYFATNASNAGGALSADDILGAQTLYGVHGATAPSTSTPTSTPTGVASGTGQTFRSTAANETFNGTAGVDTVQYYGTRAQYNINHSGNTTTVSDTVANRDGSDTLNNVEQVQFSDVTLVFDLNSSQDRMVYLLYQAAAGRMPDIGGFRYWAPYADQTGASGLQLADLFLSVPEISNRFGGLDNPDYVFAIYSNVLTRRPDQAGWDFWTAALNKGYARDQLLVDFAMSQENVNTTASHMSNGFWVT